MRRYTVAAILAAMWFISAAAVSAQEDYVVLKAFAEDANRPLGALVKASDGNLYGGSVRHMYRFRPDGSYEAINDLFTSHPAIQASDGFLYTHNGSEIYRVALSGEYTRVAYFGDSFLEGAIRDSLVEGPDGNFYGLAARRSSNTRLFRMTPAGVISDVRDDFTNGEQMQLGLLPDGSLQVTDESLLGRIYRVALDGTTTTFYQFLGGDLGQKPRAPLLPGKDGVFYGTARGGRIGDGIIFKLVAGELTVLHEFRSEAQGHVNDEQLLAATDGSLYGGTDQAIYRLTPSNEFRLLQRTNNQIEADRWGMGYTSVVEGTDGHFYGTAALGGPGSNGVLFRLNRQRSPCANVVEFSLRMPTTQSDLTMTQVIKAESPAFMGAWFVSQYGVVPMWAAVVPELSPTEAFEVRNDSFAPIGQVGVFSLVVTSDHHVCADWKTVDTGGSGPTQAQLAEILARYRPKTP